MRGNSRCFEQQFLPPPQVCSLPLIGEDASHPIAVTMRDDVLSVRISMSESPVRPGSSVGAGADHFSSTTKSHYQDQLREGLSFKPTVYHKVCRWRLKHHLPT